MNIYHLSNVMQNIYNRSIYFKVLFRKPPNIIMYINGTISIIDKQSSIMVSYVDIIGLSHSVAIL